MGIKSKCARQLHILSARGVMAAKAGKHSDGGGLTLVVGDDGSARWGFRYTSPTGKRREAGLGVVMRDSVASAGASLTAARDAAHLARTQLRQGVDPLEARESQKQAKRKADEEKRRERQRERWTLARCARDYHARVIEKTRTPKHSRQWITSLEHHVPAHVWHAPIDRIDAPALLEALLAIEPHERARNLTEDHRLQETVSRIRQRLDAVFEDSQFYGRVTGNPARAILRKLREGMGRRERGNFAALDFREVPAFVRALRQQQGVAPRALEFTLLCAARTGETLGATWDEFDTHAGIWRVSGARMKCREDHVVYLSPRALEIIEAMRQVGGDPWVFPSPMNRERPLSNMAMLGVLRRMNLASETTVHGICRASFSTWAYETGAARGDVIEATLAHREADRVKRAYSRASFDVERRALLATWARFCDGEVVETPQALPLATVHRLPVAA